MIKSKYVAEETRATVYNIFRIPLNIIVVSVLSNIKTMSDNTVFIICGFLLLAAAGMQHVFGQMVCHYMNFNSRCFLLCAHSLLVHSGEDGRCKGGFHGAGSCCGNTGAVSLGP